MQNAPLHEILQGAGILEQQAINSILPANGQLEDTVIVRMLLHYAEQAYPTVKVAVLHPEFVARFYVTTADGAYEGMALLNDISDQNKASNYLYGVQQGFDVLLIPIHKRAQMDRGEHWMLGIYEASYGERQLLVCDPVDNPLPIDAVLRKILRHVLNTVVTNEKLKGCIVKPRNAYNHQDDASSCGVYIVFYARQYLSHRRLFLDKNFQEADERKQIYEFVVNSDQLNMSGPSEAASFTSSTNMHALNIQDPMITPLRPTRAVKQRSKERISDILMELNASQREKYRDYERRRRKNETMRGRNIRLEEQRRRNERLRRAAKSRPASTYKNAATSDVEYQSLGPFNVACIHDGALHFPEERVKNKIHVDSFGDCCLHGRIKLPMPEFPDELALLFVRQHRLSEEFHRRIRNIDACFALASFKVDDDRTVNQHGIYAFIAGGQVHHKINLATRPTQDPQGGFEQPKFAQMYFMDPDEATAARSELNRELSQELLKLLEEIMRFNNPFAQSFMMMREVIEETNQRAIAAGVQPPNVHLVFTNREGDDPRRFNAPVVNEIAAVLTLNADQSIPENEMVMRERGKKITHLSNIDGRVEPFTYPLFYPRGTFGFYVGMPLHTPYPSRNHVTRAELACYRLAYRPNYAKPLPIDCTNAGIDQRLVEFNALHFGGRLLQQYVVDTYIRVERDRIQWIKSHQREIQAEKYAGVHNMLRSLAAQKDAAIGETTILPSSFPGSTRWYTENFEDSMALVRRFGSPEFFITVTCNPQWPELLSAIRNEFNATIPDSLLALTRPDIVARVARLKFRQIVEDIMMHQIFGRASAYVFTIEFQKRGLPHMHLLMIMSPADKIHSADQLDDFISAEIPEDDPELKELISKWMIHNLCGDMNPSAPCMVSKHGRDQCRWGFPMEHQDMTSLVDYEKPRYRRRYNPLLDPMNPEFSHEQAIYRKDCNGQRVTTDSRHVVPYNAYLLKKYQCHINVEFVGSIGPVKYLYKYIYKGHDCATIKAVENQQTIIYNEPEKYVEARYISPVEACWRLFKDFEIQAKSHTVVRLDIHLPGQDSVNLDQTPFDLADIGQKGSTLRAYFRHNTALKEDEANGKAVTYHYYHEMPEHYRWIGQTSTWQKNVNACSRIGRVHPVNFVSKPELFFLRTLLFHVKEPTNFRDLYIVDGVQHATYKQACLARGLTYDDQQYVEGLRESASSKMPSVMRILFAQILILGAPENPKRLWELFKEDLAEDFIREARRTGGSIEEAIKRAYRIMAHKLNTEATEGRNFRYWVQTHGMEDIDNYEQDLEHDRIDVDESTAIGDRMYQQLNEKQREIVNTIIQALEDPTPAAKCFFIDGPGGTGKTFVYSTLYRIVTGRLKKVKCMAYTGIAAILLPSGQTTHRTFGLKVPLTSDSRSSIKPGSPKANALKGAHMCLMDEAPMMSKYGLHNIDELLRAICNNIPFGGKVMVLGGDFRQCCPVQQRANKSEILDLLIKRSHLWQHFKTYSLEKNMRVDPEEEEFAKYLLKLGDGELEGNELGEIEVPEEIRSGGNLIDEIFGPCLRSGNYEAMKNRAILAPLNDDKDKINEQIIAMLPGEEKTYTSFDSVKDQHEGGIQFAPEFLNSINIADLPPHNLKLKKNAIIMLLRNLDVSEGMCNGTRLIVTELCNNIIKAKIITGEHADRQVHLPRITLDSSKSQLGATMQRHQFPVTPAFAITIHKSQGQTFEFVGVLLLTTVFVHGMLYVAFSRVKRQSALKVLLPPENPTHTRNVVWKEVLNKRNSPAAPASPTRNYLDNMEDFAIDD